MNWVESIKKYITYNEQEMKDKETRVFCANNYMRAQTAFEKVN